MAIGKSIQSQHFDLVTKNKFTERWNESLAALFRLTWVILPSLCCIPLILFFIAGTIVLALIPIYLSNKDLDRNGIRGR